VRFEHVDILTRSLLCSYHCYLITIPSTASRSTAYTKKSSFQKKIEEKKNSFEENTSVYDCVPIPSFDVQIQHASWVLLTVVFVYKRKIEEKKSVKKTNNCYLSVYGVFRSELNLAN
jgi:hypothetical protein